MILIPFLVLTFAISAVGFAFILTVPAARNPENLSGLPFWLLMVWGPTLAAIILSLRNGELAHLLGRAVQVSTVPPAAWALVIAPLLLLVLLKPFAPEAPMPLGAGLAISIIGFNLFLGPLGEELGWRGVLQAHLNQRIGWLQASLVIGVIWLVWHLPLWTVDSPQARIPLPLFAVHVMLYAVIIGAAYTLSAGSILPAILIHLTVNLAANYAIFAGFRTPDAWFSASLVPFAILAIGAVAAVNLAERAD